MQEDMTTVRRDAAHDEKKKTPKHTKRESYKVDVDKAAHLKGGYIIRHTYLRLTNMRALPLPLRQSCNRKVSFEFLNGTWV